MEKTSRRRKYIGKHVKPTDENIMQLLMPSILGMLICMVCLAGATWAWFTATTTVSAPAVSAAYFDVTTVITPEASVTDDDENEVRTYTIEKNKPYTVTLTATGNASIGGYCVVRVDGDTYYTGHMKLGDNLSFSVCSSAGSIEIIPYWGTPSSDSNNKITNHTQIGKLPASNDETLEAPDENSSGAVNNGGSETGSNDNSAANNDNTGDHNTSQSEQPSPHPANEDKGGSSDNNGGNALDSADTTPSASDNSAGGGGHDNTSASSSDSGNSGSSDSGSGSGGNSDSSSSGGGESSGGGSGGGESSGGGSANAAE